MLTVSSEVPLGRRGVQGYLPTTALLTEYFHLIHCSIQVGNITGGHGLNLAHCLAAVRVLSTETTYSKQVLYVLSHRARRD